LHVPTLVVAGDLDVEEKLQLAHELETGIVGARRVIVPGTAHMLTMEQPNTFRDIVFNFLQQIS
jgi:3-oxoadipate enol-lactonase